MVGGCELVMHNMFFLNLNATKLSAALRCSPGGELECRALAKARLRGGFWTPPKEIDVNGSPSPLGLNSPPPSRSSSKNVKKKGMIRVPPPLSGGACIFGMEDGLIKSTLATRELCSSPNELDLDSQCCRHENTQFAQDQLGVETW